MTQTARIRRMVLEDHLCPSGLKAKALLERSGFTVDDQPFHTRVEVDAFKEEHDVKTTPQIWIEGERIGGYDALRKHLGKDTSGRPTYRPVIAIFVVAAALALVLSWSFYGSSLTLRAVEWFVSISMTLLAVQKLQDVERFSTMFLNYDLLARRYVPYAYIYPYAEGLAGVLMVGGVLWFVAAPLALFIGTIGAISVFKAVYVDKRELKCACVGGDKNVPLGFVSLTENLFMIGAGIWVLLKNLVLV
jgi:glutaredoxin